MLLAQLCRVVCTYGSAVKTVVIPQVAASSLVLQSLEAFAHLVSKADGEPGKPPTMDSV